VNLFAFDTETTSLDYYSLKLVGISLYNPDFGQVFIQFNFFAKFFKKVQDFENKRRKIVEESIFNYKKGIEFNDAKPYLIKFFTGKKIIGHNTKFDYKVAYKYGFSDYIIEDDTLLMSYLIDVNSQHGLKETVKKYLNVEMTTLEEVLGNLKQINWETVSFNDFADYAVADALYTYELKFKLLPLIEKYKLDNVYRKIELPIVKAVAGMEISGIEIDLRALKKISKKAHEKLFELSEDIFDLAGVTFNLNSPQQLAEVLFTRLKYKVVGYTKKGKLSVDESVLKFLMYSGSLIAEKLLEYRSLEKLVSTYADKIPLMVDEDNRLRGNFNQTGARTGRFSSSEPNLQNQVNSEEYPVRSAYIPKKGYSFVIFDWKTIEIRVMAHRSQDAVLLKILREGRDVHQETADLLTKLSGVKITRFQGKTLNFAILYGMQMDSLAYNLNLEIQKKYSKILSKKELKNKLFTSKSAQKLIDTYYKMYSGFSQYGNSLVDNALKFGFVKTMGGRIRFVPELKHRSTYFAGRRIAVNTDIQGGAADLMKIGIRDTVKFIAEKNYDAKLLLTVHDELLFEVKNSQAQEFMKNAKLIMENIYPKFSVPILADSGIFKNWNEMKLRGSKSQSFIDLKLNKVI
jgi:DNA polymerase-1